MAIQAQEPEPESYHEIKWREVIHQTLKFYIKYLPLLGLLFIIPMAPVIGLKIFGGQKLGLAMIGIIHGSDSESLAKALYWLVMLAVSPLVFYFLLYAFSVVVRFTHAKCRGEESEAAYIFVETSPLLPLGLFFKMTFLGLLWLAALGAIIFLAPLFSIWWGAGMGTILGYAGPTVLTSLVQALIILLGVAAVVESSSGLDMYQRGWRLWRRDGSASFFLVFLFVLLSHGYAITMFRLSQHLPDSYGFILYFSTYWAYPLPVVAGTVLYEQKVFGKVNPPSVSPDRLYIKVPQKQAPREDTDVSEVRSSQSPSSK